MNNRDPDRSPLFGNHVKHTGLVDQQLNDQARRFLANPGKGLRVAPDGVHVSRIFDWFAADFASAGGVLRFIARYAEVPTDAGYAADIDYNWRLNGD